MRERSREGERVTENIKPFHTVKNKSAKVKKYTGKVMLLETVASNIYLGQKKRKKN